MTIQNKITLLFTVLTGALILLFCTFLYLFARNSVQESFFHRLEVRSDIAAHVQLQTDTNRTELYNEFKVNHLGNLPAEAHRSFYGNHVKMRDSALAAGYPEDFVTEAIFKGTSRYFSTDTFYVARYLKLGDDQVLMVSEAVDESGFEELASLKKSIYIGLTIALVAVFTFGRLFARAVFQPVRDIIRKVNNIKASNLHLRLEKGNGKDEISALIVTFNNMLNRLETTFQLQNNFVSNASHELKTPLTVISGEAELALMNPGNSEQVNVALRKILDEADRLENLMNSLLNLAQTGFDGKKLPVDKIRIDELLLAVKLDANRIFPKNKIEIDFNHMPDNDKDMWLMGNAAILKVALMNIVNNACKYSKDKRVIIKISSTGKEIVVSVSDEGIGIPSEELQSIFIPFFRASNTENFKGYGIGLPLSRNIIERHGGSISAESIENKGTVVQVTLPVAGI